MDNPLAISFLLMMVTGNYNPDKYHWAKILAFMGLRWFMMFLLVEAVKGYYFHV